MRASLFVALLAAGAATFTGCFASLDGFSGGSGAADAGDAAVAKVDGSAELSAGRDGATPPDAAASTDPYGDAVRADGPAAWYRFEDAPGSTTIKDETGAHPGTVEDSITLGVTGAVGQGCLFASNGDVNLGDVFDFAGVSEFTIELWADDQHPRDDYDDALFKRRDDPNAEDGWVFFRDKYNGTWQFQFWAGGNVNESLTSDQAPSGLHHVVISQAPLSDGNVSLAMYIDGVVQTSNTAEIPQSTEPDTNISLYIGSGWNGILDEIAFYDHALSADRAAAHFAAAHR